MVDLRLEPRTYTLSNMMTETVFLLIAVETQSVGHTGTHSLKVDSQSVPGLCHFCFHVCTKEAEKNV